MRAALRFLRELQNAALLDAVTQVTVDLYGSLALTGKGHGTDRAVMLGLMGEVPDTVDAASVDAKIAEVRFTDWLRLGGRVGITFQEDDDLRFRREQMYPDAGVVSHPNGMRFIALGADGVKLAEEVFYSIGGGFIVSEAERVAGQDKSASSARVVPYPFRSAEEMLRLAEENGLTIADLVLANEVALLADERVKIVRPACEGSTVEQMHEDRVRASVMIVMARHGGLRATGHGGGGNSARRVEGAATRSTAGAKTVRAGAQRKTGSAGCARLGDHVGDGGERGERGRRARGDGAYQRRGRSDPCDRALLSALPV
jgi:L-serine dehydratase